MRYSDVFIKSVLKRVLPPNNESQIKVTQELNLGKNTIYNWIKKHQNGNLNKLGDTSSSNKNPNEMLTLLLESKAIDSAEYGQWLRGKGLHSEHMHLFEQEIVEIVNSKSNLNKTEIKELKNDNAVLRKELRRKDKALAEMAALVILKKKANAIWGEKEDD